MQVKAISKNIRISPSKVKLVSDELKKMKPQEAVKILDFTHKSAAKPVKKVIQSAISNAKNNYNLDEASLKFNDIQVGPGSTLKRYRAISRGRPHSIFKRTSNIRIELEGKINQAKKNVSNINETKKQTKEGTKKNGSKS